MVPKLTLDGGLLRENVLLPSVQILKTWDADGRIEIFESDRAKEPKGSGSYGWPGAPPVSQPRPRFKMVRKSDSGKASFQQISAVLFPQRDPHRLNMVEVNDVAHLMNHHAKGHSIFVTTKVETFISQGRRERLQAAFKIIILTPEEAIVALEESNAMTPIAPKRASHE